MPGHNVYSVIGVGAGRFHSPGRSKEGDSGIKCSTRVAGNEWLNLMIEVGDSEPLRQLRFDGQWWLLNSGGRTNVVILVQVEKEPKSVIIEVWELVPNPDQRTRFASPTIPAATTRLSIDGAGVVAPANGSLVIPYDAVFDNPHPDAAPIIFYCRSHNYSSSDTFSASLLMWQRVYPASSMCYYYYSGYYYYYSLFIRKCLLCLLMLYTSLTGSL